MQAVIEIFNHPFFLIVSGILIIFFVIQIISTAYLYAKGIIPVWIRIGRGLSKRKIAIFAEGDDFTELRSMLVDSGLFLKSNVVKIEKNSIKKAESMTLFLVHWKSFGSQLEEILQSKKDHSALIIYAPQKEGIIDPTRLKKITNVSNTTVVNLRGRLLNDIFISMITTGYEAK
jgi:hypothetical protein